MSQQHLPGATGDAATTPPPEERSLSDVLGAVAEDLTDLFRTELDLAKAELKQEAGRAGKGAGMLGGAAVAGHLVLALLSVVVIALLDLALPLWAAALIVTALWAAVAAALALLGRRELQSSNPQLPRTQQSLQSLKENAR
ncbi:phage holin family protein [Nocardioides nanhaiensis]|uniref:Phage holin family protein n=1 Tax=Nocardioides nanhaiensis TaxID=1476871 RepID=A0ABP8VW95_9ACTN